MVKTVCKKLGKQNDSEVCSFLIKRKLKNSTKVACTGLKRKQTAQVVESSVTNNHPFRNFPGSDNHIVNTTNEFLPKNSVQIVSVVTLKENVRHKTPNYL